MHTETIKMLRSLFIGAFIALVIGAAIRIVFYPIIVEGDSMKPSYTNGEIVITSRDVTALKRGDVVVADPGTGNIIKRVVGIPGDILWVENGVLYVNGSESPYQFDAIAEAGALSVPLTIAQGTYFLMGDNRNNSWDSRAFGALELYLIRSKVVKAVQFGGKDRK